MEYFWGNFWAIIWMSLAAILVIIFCYQLLRRSSEPESLFMQALLFIPKTVTNLLQSLTMDEKGFSLKKILAVYGTVIGGKVTLEHANDQNCITFVIIWLAWSGILVGIYSLDDITGALSKYKKVPQTEEEKK